MIDVHDSGITPDSAVDVLHTSDSVSVVHKCIFPIFFDFLKYFAFSSFARKHLQKNKSKKKSKTMTSARPLFALRPKQSVDDDGDEPVDTECVKTNTEWCCAHNSNVDDSVFEISVRVTLPNCCAICSHQYDEAHLNEVDQTIQSICAEGSEQHFAYDKKKLADDAEHLLEFLTKSKQITQRYCMSCFEKTLRAHAMKKTSFRDGRDDEVYMSCPFCFDYAQKQHRALIKTEAIPFVLQDALSKQLQKALEREFTDRHYTTAYCPVLGCEYVQTFGKTNRRADYRANKLQMETQFVHCPAHGNRCVLCWKTVIESSKHNCSGTPEEFFTEECARDGGLTLGRCPHCFSAILKNGGCDHMTCRCGREFLWQEASIVVKKPNPSAPPAPISPSTAAVVVTVTKPNSSAPPAPISTISSAVVVGITPANASSVPNSSSLPSLSSLSPSEPVRNVARSTTEGQKRVVRQRIRVVMPCPIDGCAQQCNVLVARTATKSVRYVACPDHKFVCLRCEKQFGLEHDCAFDSQSDSYEENSSEEQSPTLEGELSEGELSVASPSTAERTEEKIEHQYASTSRVLSRRKTVNVATSFVPKAVLRAATGTEKAAKSNKDSMKKVDGIVDNAVAVAASAASAAAAVAEQTMSPTDENTPQPRLPISSRIALFEQRCRE